MRVGVWWAFMLTLLAIASALRTTQTEGASRTSKRLSAPSGPSEPSAPTQPDKADETPSEYTFKSRASRRNDEIPLQEFTRTRPRSRKTVSENDRPKPDERNERHDSRRSYSRTRNRTKEPEAMKEQTIKENVVRNGNRFSSRRQSTPSTAAPIEASSPVIDESKIEVVSTTLDEIAKSTPREDAIPTQYIRRIPVSQTTESIKPRRGRTRINVRTNLKPLDLTVSGTTNTVIISNKEPTTARTAADVRTSKKLRYKPRRLETGTNLTGKGIATTNEATKSSQNKDITSQPGIRPTPAAIQITAQASAEVDPPKTTTNRATKAVRRPLAREKVNFKPSASLSKIKKKSDEISEDDNYPASFKALLQAKNGSTQANSLKNESLSVRASQKVYNTITPSEQSTDTTSEYNKTSRFRGKASAGVNLKQDEDKTAPEPNHATSQDDQPKPKYVSRHRGSFNPNRNRKFGFTTSSSTTESTVLQSTKRPAYKYNRKFKVSTTELPSTGVTFKQRKIESSNLIKKTAVRPTFFARRKNSTTTTESSAHVENVSMENDASNVVVRKNILPKTSYYSRLKDKNKIEQTSSTTEAVSEAHVELNSTENKKEAPADMPFIFSLLNKPSEEENKLEMSTEVKKPEKQKEMFIIAVTSKESQESNNENSLTNNEEEENNTDKPLSGFVSSTSKYHEIFKEESTEKEADLKEQKPSRSSSPVRKIHTRKLGRQRSKPKEEHVEETVVPTSVTPRSRERNSRKFSDSYSKTTEPSTNGIQPIVEKSKNRYSSKFRSSYIDKPFYKATVPTVTPSTAWLKFFVTDQQLAKAVEQSDWFGSDDLFLPTDTPWSFTTQPTNHESSIELVEGEEFQLGPDMNAISLTLPRSTLSSADLRLSESVMKPSHIMNIETLQHSSSVTISIFDALAEILTSTPRTPRISTTSEVKNLSNNDSKQSLKGVSNSITVNNDKGFKSQDTVTSTSNESNTYTKTVQTTHQATLSVNNSIQVKGSATSSLNTELRMVTPVNTLSASSPTPTTPISARRPFAIKLLYSEFPTDKFSTATEPINTSSTDNPSTVYNTVSDLLLTNNNLLSSELTSMLSNNIRNIIQNMDAKTRAKLRVDMDKALRSLIPRALDRLSTSNNDGDSVLNTTPYSLEEIEDTGNVDFVNSSNFDTDLNINLLQNLTLEDDVNNTNLDRSIGITPTPAEAVNIVNNTLGVPFDNLSGSNSQTTAFETNFEQTTSSDLAITTNMKISSDSVDSERNINTDTKTNFSESTNKTIPLPFLTNARIDNDNDSEKAGGTVLPQTQLLTTTLSLTPSQGIIDNVGLQDTSQVSPLQLWVLSKKAKVLKMIEDLIRQHNDELATVPTLTDIIQENNIPLSNRFNQILNTMTTTTETTDITNEGSTSPMTTSSLPLPFSTLSRSSATIQDGSTISSSTILTTTASTEVESTSTENISVNERMGLLEDFNTTSITIGTDSPRKFIETTTVTTTSETTAETNVKIQEMSSRSTDSTDMATTTSEERTETTTSSSEVGTTQMSSESLASTSTETSIQTNSDTNDTLTSANDTTQNIYNVDIGPQKIPKKDYVIFGILPNNTVVRKDPNDDILETLTEASPYIIYGLLPNNTVIRKFPNGTRVPRVMQKIDVLPISPWSLRNPYSPIHNNPAIVRPQSNPTRVSTNTVTSTDTSNNGTERLTNDTVNNQQTMMIPTSALNINDSSSLGVTTATNMSPAETSTASHVLSLRTTTMLPSVDEILLNSLSSAAKADMVLSSTTTTTREPRILTLDIDPETQQIRTEKPSDGNGNAVFKFIPIDEVTVAQQDSNVLKLATKAPFSPSTAKPDIQTVTAIVTEINTQTPQIQTQQTAEDPTTTVQLPAATPSVRTTETVFTNPPPSTVESRFSIFTMSPTVTTEATTTSTRQIMTEPTTIVTTIMAPTTMQTPTTTQAPTTTHTPTTTPVTTTTAPITTTLVSTTTPEITTVTALPTTEEQRYQEDARLLQNILQNTERNAKSLNVFTNSNQIPNEATTAPITSTRLTTTTLSENDRLVQAILAAQSPSTISIPNIGGNLRISQTQSTPNQPLEDDLKQFEEDTKLLKALLAATGQNTANFNIPTLDNINIPNRLTSTIPTTTTIRQTTTQQTKTQPTTTAGVQTTTRIFQTTTPSIEEDIKMFSEDAKLLQALLRATGQNFDNRNIPTITANSNVRIASNPLTTSLGSNPTTPLNIRPVYSLRTTTESPRQFTTTSSRTTPVLITLQPVPTTTVTGDGIASTTPPKARKRFPTTTAKTKPPTPTARRVPVSGFIVTTEIPSTSTFSDEEDIQFLKNLKSVLSTNPNNEDPESALANRIIALAVERSLNEIQNDKQADIGRTGKNVPIPTTQRATTTTTTTTTTTPRPTTTSLPISTINDNTPSLEDDIKQFQEDTKLLQALIKATGQDPSQFNIPTLPTNINAQVSSNANKNLNLVTNILASPSPLNEPFDSITQRPTTMTRTRLPTTTVLTAARPFGARIVVKDNLKNVQDDAKLLQTLVKLQGARETTTQRSKLAITGQSTDEALKKLIQQTKPASMMSDATKAPVSISTEYGKSNDALLAALLKEQGFGPTTASSLDEQLRLAALLNQVVVTPKARRTTTTPPPPPPAQRRPILDGLAWLWQQWRETGPGPGGARPNRRPSPSAGPTISSASSSQQSSRLNWLGSGPFVGNADEDRETSRVPLEPPRVVAASQAPGRGQLVSAAINVTRAFSQFLGAAIQGAAKTVQSVIQAGQRATNDIYANGSG